MPRWTAITADDLKAAGHGLLVDRAATTAVGGVDPVAEAIANSVARVRRAVQAANTLDEDPDKVPGSLKSLVVRMALYALAERIGLPLSEDQRATRKSDESDLLRIGDRKVRLEPADDPDTSEAGAPVNPGTWNSENKVLGRTHPVPAPTAQRAGTSGYANPDGPVDA